MSTMTHLRCDRCNQDLVFDPEKMFRAQTGWARVVIGVVEYDLCQECWNNMADDANLKRKEPRP